MKRLPALMAWSLSLVLMAGLVGTTPVVAQGTEGVTPAGLNADTVDGKHAVSATNKKKARRNKLVAADASGFLPSNVVKPLWNLIQGLPTILADGKISWTELVGTPAGFADGVDDVGTPGYYSFTYPSIYQAGDTCDWYWLEEPSSVDTELMIIPTETNGEVEIEHESFRNTGTGKILHYYCLMRQPTSATNPTLFKIRLRVFNQGIAAAALKEIARDIKVHVTRKHRR